MSQVVTFNGLKPMEKPYQQDKKRTCDRLQEVVIYKKRF